MSKIISLYPTKITQPNSNERNPITKWNFKEVRRGGKTYPYGSANPNDPRYFHAWTNTSNLLSGGIAQCGRPSTYHCSHKTYYSIKGYRNTCPIAGCNGTYNSLTKYCTSSYYGVVDNKTELELADDAARQNWGGDWRMPTYYQIDELQKECTSTITTWYGVKGLEIKSKKNGNSIFLPAAGAYSSGWVHSLAGETDLGEYWSRSGYERTVRIIKFGSKTNFNTDGDYFQSPCFGLSIRPVMSKE